jgi:hypothetical protein
MASMIDRAIDDLRGNGPKGTIHDTDYAMAFILSETCEVYCLELKIEYERIREKAVGLYQRFIAKKDKKAIKKKCARTPAKPPHTAKPRKTPYRYRQVDFRAF